MAWAETTGNGRYLLFKTENSEYYASVRSSLKARGGAVADFEGASTKQRRSLPVLVYEETTEDSVNSIESLLRKNEVNSSMVCALLDRVGRHLIAAARVAVASSSIGVARVQRGDLLRLFYARAPRYSEQDATQTIHTGRARRRRPLRHQLNALFATARPSFSSSSFQFSGATGRRPASLLELAFFFFFFVLLPLLRRRGSQTRGSRLFRFLPSAARPDRTSPSSRRSPCRQFLADRILGRRWRELGTRCVHFCRGGVVLHREDSTVIRAPPAHLDVPRLEGPR